MSSYNVHAKREFAKNCGPGASFDGVLVMPGIIEVSYTLHRTGQRQTVAVKADTIGRKSVELAAAAAGKWAANKAEAAR